MHVGQFLFCGRRILSAQHARRPARPWHVPGHVLHSTARRPGDLQLCYDAGFEKPNLLPSDTSGTMRAGREGRVGLPTVFHPEIRLQQTGWRPAGWRSCSRNPPAMPPPPRLPRTTATPARIWYHHSTYHFRLPPSPLENPKARAPPPPGLISPRKGPYLRQRLR